MVRRKRHAQSIRQLVVFHRHVEYPVLGRRKGRRCANQQAEAKRECQNTARCCFVALLASEKRGSAVMPSSSRPATYSPTAGPCLKPWPEPPPTSHTFSNSGCRSIRKSPLDVFSYWHTRVSTTGALRNAGKRRATYLRVISVILGVTMRGCVSGSILSP